MEPHWTVTAMFWATVVVGLITTFATAINFFLYRSQTDPEVIVYTKHDPMRASIITLVIENIGRSVAHDVTFSLSDKIPERAYGFKSIPEENIVWIEDGPLVSGIPSLQPGGKREMNWGQYHGLTSVIGKKQFKIKARFKAKKLFSPEPVPCETESIIDIRSYTGTVAHDENEPKKIREEITEIKKAIVKLVNGQAAFRIIVEDESDAQQDS